MAILTEKFKYFFF